jgi:hypothetical protein
MHPDFSEQPAAKQRNFARLQRDPHADQSAEADDVGTVRSSATSGERDDPIPPRSTEGGTGALAHTAGLSVATYARIERRQVNPTWTTVRRVVEALGLSFAQFGEALDAGESPPSPGKRT